MKTVSFISAKGGSGKTILTATIADFIGNLGKRVLLVDADGSTNGMTLFYLKEILNQSNDNANKYGVLQDGFAADIKNFTEISNGIYFLPATYSFSNTENYSYDLFEKHIFDLVNNYRNQKEPEFDFILIDCQAGADKFSEIVTKKNVTDEVVIVSEFDPISAAGIERLKGLFHKNLTYERTWVLLNKVLPELIVSSSDFLEITKYLPPVAWSSEVVKKYSRKEIATDFKYGNEYTFNIVKILNALFSKELGSELKKWLDERNEILRKPIMEEVFQLEQEYRKLELTEKSSLKSTLMPTIISASAIVGVVSSLISFSSSLGISDSLQSMLKSEILIGIIASLLAAFSLSGFNYFRKRDSIRSKHKLEKEYLKNQMKELRDLSRASIDVILKSNRNLHNKH